MSEQRPIIQCEYAHAMGNGNGNYKEYWDAFEANPSMQVPTFRETGSRAPQTAGHVHVSVHVSVFLDSCQHICTFQQHMTYSGITMAPTAFPCQLRMALRDLLRLKR